jgi:BlaI family transcriptional regulator, penicillinase repressor
VFNALKLLRKSISPLEGQILEILWSRGSTTSEQVRETLASRRTLKDSTVRTILRRLCEKKYARYRIEGRTYVYSATEPPGNLAIRAVRSIIDRFCKGSVEELLTGMIQHEILGPSELQRLARKIAQRKSPKRKPL